MFSRKFGPYERVIVVDVTGLITCRVVVIGREQGNPTPMAEGPKAEVKKIKVQAAVTSDGTMLTLSNQSGIVRRTGNAVAGPGSSANTGVRGNISGRLRIGRTGDAVAVGPGSYASSGYDASPASVRTRVIQRDEEFVREVPGVELTVMLFVRPGTEVRY